MESKWNQYVCGFGEKLKEEGAVSVVLDSNRWQLLTSTSQQDLKKLLRFNLTRVFALLKSNILDQLCSQSLKINRTQVEEARQRNKVYPQHSNSSKFVRSNFWLEERYINLLLIQRIIVTPYVVVWESSNVFCHGEMWQRRKGKMFLS